MVWQVKGSDKLPWMPWHQVTRLSDDIFFIIIKEV